MSLSGVGSRAVLTISTRVCNSIHSGSYSQVAFFFQGVFGVTKIVIDNVEYDSEALSPEALAQVQSIQFVDAEVARLQGRVAAMNTARMAYSAALQELLSSESNHRDVSGS